jgi:predicted RNA polymerase sigma factor
VRWRQRFVRVSPGTPQVGCGDAEELEPLADHLDRYVYLHVAQADMQSRLGNRAASVVSYQRAHDLAANEVQRAALRRKLDAAVGAEA